MNTRRITFAIEYPDGSISNRLSAEVEMIDEQFNQLNMDMKMGCHNLNRYILNNLFYIVIEQINPTQEWVPVDPLIY